jgi:putative Ca2+/H+ antiporter (TMEM165/GDT1 family)
MSLFLTVFITVFLAELGDKTQLATMLYATDAKNPRLTVFAASSLALVVSAGLGVAAGSVVSQYVTPRFLSVAAGTSFILIGIWTIVRA